ncbi:MAG: SUF system Fe-S cluster assembly regulator [Deltaproteobacteria bacterium]|nr:SUF system Fe-S cluster assembly regulator [Deltaproteobacteria bacterium]
MLKLGKLTDYAIVLLTYTAHDDGSEPLTARSLATRAGLPVPTVSKLLKQLGRAELLVSQRGAHGGYSLARPAGQISIAEVIAAIEGPIALTECSADRLELCEIESGCPVRSNWRLINNAVVSSLRALTLKDMTPVTPRPEQTLVQISSPRSISEAERGLR